MSGGGGNAPSGGASASMVGGTSSSGGASTTVTGGANAAVTGGAKSSGGSSASNGGVNNAGGTTSALTGGSSSAKTGGAPNTGGASVTSTGGTKNTGGTAALTGGARSTGGVTSATGGTSAVATGGRVGTGGGSSTVPTGLPSTCGSTNCDAATTVNPKLTSYGALGNVTMYSTNASSGGACIYGTTNIMYYAAINANLAPGDGLGQWQGGTICGQCFEVTVVTSQGFKTVVVRITDKCPDGYCGMDLGGSAPAAVMVDGIGRYQGAWRAVSCAGHPEVSDGAPSLHVKDGSNPGWSAIQIRNPIMAVSGIDYKDVNNGAIGGSMGLAPGIENYYLVPTDALAGTTLKLTVRYGDGSTATITIPATNFGMPDTTYPLD